MSARATAHAVRSPDVGAQRRNPGKCSRIPLSLHAGYELQQTLDGVFAGKGKLKQILSEIQRDRRVL